MKRIILFICLLTLVGCGRQSDNLLNYKNSYIGDNSAVGNILSLLPVNLQDYTFSLQTTSEPYELTVNYSNTKLTEDDLNYSADILFTLIQNVEIIHFKSKDSVSTFSRPSDEFLQRIEKELTQAS